MSLNVKKGDNVVLLTGKDNGKTGKVTAVNTKTGRIVVENANKITKHVKARSANEQSRIDTVDGSVDASNVMIVCPACNKATRVAHQMVNGKKVRVCKKCGAFLDVKEEKTEKKTKKAKAAKSADAATAETSAKKTRKSKKTEEAQA